MILKQKLLRKDDEANQTLKLQPFQLHGVRFIILSLKIKTLFFYVFSVTETKIEVTKCTTNNKKQ